MERLTEKRNGTNVIPLRNAICGTDMPYWKITTAGDLTEYLSGNAADRLAAYEDTGLEPEEIKDFVSRWKEATELAGLCKEAGIDHLRELAEADRDGRLVVLPCKVGQAVWFIDRRYNREIRGWESIIQEGYVKAIKFSARPEKITVEYPDVGETNGRCKGCDYFISNIGKTVFLSQLEAEAALKAGEPQ